MRWMYSWWFMNMCGKLKAKHRSIREPTSQRTYRVPSRVFCMGLERVSFDIDCTEHNPNDSSAYRVERLLLRWSPVVYICHRSEFDLLDRIEPSSLVQTYSPHVEHVLCLDRCQQHVSNRTSIDTVRPTCRQSYDLNRVLSIDQTIFRIVITIGDFRIALAAPSEERSGCTTK